MGLADSALYQGLIMFVESRWPSGSGGNPTAAPWMGVGGIFEAIFDGGQVTKGK